MAFIRGISLTRPDSSLTLHDPSSTDLQDTEHCLKPCNHFIQILHKDVHSDQNNRRKNSHP